MKGTYFRTLVPCAVGSVVLLAAAYAVSAYGSSPTGWFKQLPQLPLVLRVFAIAPMVYYHRALYRWSQKTQLDVPAIDSVYYYGFLLTVAALAVSALEVAIPTEGPLELSPILTNFAVGLCATGYAVIARMHLTSMPTFVGLGSPEEVMMRYLKTSLELVDNVEYASTRLAKLSETIMAKTADVAEKARLATEQTVLSAGKAFDVEMRESLSGVRQGLVDIRQITSDPDFTAERNTFSKSVRLTGNAVVRLSESLAELTQKTKDSVEATGDATTATVAAAASVSLVSRQLADLGGPAGTLPATLAAFEEASRTLAKGSLLVGSSIESMSGLAEAIARAKESFAGLVSLSNSVALTVGQLANLSEELEKTAGGVTEVSSAASTLAKELTSASTALPQIAQRADELTAILDKLRNGIAKSAAALEGDVDRSAKAATMLTESLSRVAQAVVDRTRQHAAKSV